MLAFKRAQDKTPYWRTLKANGELNAKYPGGVEAQKEMLEKEGHIVIQKGRINIKCCTDAKATEMIIFVEKCLIDNIFHDG